MTTKRAAQDPGVNTMYQQMGGAEGLIVSALPILVIIFGSKRFGLVPSLVAALAIAIGYFIYRKVAGKSLQPGISAIIGVGIGAAFALITGETKGFFLYGIWMSLVYAVVFLVSVIVRWPAVPAIWYGINGKGTKWRTVPGTTTYFTIATLVWCIVFAARFGVQRFLYEKDLTDALGLVRIAMGFPLTAVALAVCVWMMKKAGAVIHEYEQRTGEVIFATAPAATDTQADDSAGPTGAHNLDIPVVGVRNDSASTPEK